MKEDVPSNHASKMLPILDTQMRMVDGQIVHHHYLKPMASLEITLGRSALSHSSKLNIIVQEGNRRLRNTSKTIPWKDKVHLINKLMIQMYWAGYRRKDREIVSKRILAKQENDRVNHETEGKEYYRTKEERRQTFKTNKATWFRAAGATTILMVPMTNNSTLAKNLRETIRQFPGPKGTVVKVVEKPGNPILAGLAPNDPFKSLQCPKEDCPITKKPCRGRCGIENIIYTATCNICEDRQLNEDTSPECVVHRQYLGETSRTLRIRAGQHRSDFIKCASNKQLEEGTSWMWDHHEASHGPNVPIDPHNYSFNILSTFKDAMTRQIQEASRIQQALERGTHIDPKGTKTSIVSLNRKNEFFQQRSRNYFQ